MITSSPCGCIIYRPSSIPFQCPLANPVAGEAIAARTGVHVLRHARRGISQTRASSSVHADDREAIFSCFGERLAGRSHHEFALVGGLACGGVVVQKKSTSVDLAGPSFDDA